MSHHVRFTEKLERGHIHNTFAVESDSTRKLFLIVFDVESLWMQCDRTEGLPKDENVQKTKN